MRSLLVALAAVGLSALALPVAAQDPGVLGVLEGRQATPGGYFYNAQPGEPITRVNVWGAVARPGVYDVGAGFGIQSVLTLAGVAADRTPSAGTPPLVVRLQRAGQAEPVYEGTVAELAVDPDPPALRYGDVLAVAAEGVASVAVWGAVARPGVYDVGPALDAKDVLALAGGPQYPALRDAQEVRTRVRLYRGGGDQPAFDADLPTFLAAPPAVRDGDVLQLESTVDQGWTTRDTFSVAGLITSGTIAVVQFLRLLRVD